MARSVSLSVRLSPAEWGYLAAAARILSLKTGARVGAGTVLRLGGIEKARKLLSDEGQGPMRRSGDER